MNRPQHQTVTLSGLRAVLKQELAQAAPTAANAPRHLAALVELGKLEASARQRFLAGYAPDAHAGEHAETPSGSPPLRAHSLFHEPKYAELVPYGPMLIMHTEGADALLDALGNYDSGTVSAWIVSVLPVDELARHLGNFARARKSINSPEDEHYILRYYDPKTLPRVRELAASTRWWQLLFTPITQWWFPFATPQAESWRLITGGGEWSDPERFKWPRWLLLTDEVWEALEGDPLPYKLTDVLQQQAPDLFKSKCYGVRVAQVEECLAEAREQGLQSDRDFLVYIWCVIAQPAIRQDAHWREAVKRAAEGKAALELPGHWNNAT